MKRILNVFKIIFILHSITTAQSFIPDSSVYNLDSIVVQSTRYEQPVSSAPLTIDIIEINKIGTGGNGTTAANLLETVPGVIVDNRTNLSQGDRILIRGIGTRAQFGVRGIKILLDGIPLTFADGQSQLNNLDINSVKKAEVIRGPGSVLYGNSAGGIISFSSTGIIKNNFSFEPLVIIGSYGLKKYIINSSGKIAGTELSLSLNRFNYKGYREHSNAESYNGNLFIKKKFNDKIKLSGVINYYNAPYLLNPSSLTKETALNSPRSARSYIISQGAGKRVNQFQSGISFIYSFSNNTSLATVIYGIGRNLLNAIPGRIIELDRTAGGIRSTLTSQLFVFDKKINITAGIDYEAMSDNRTEFSNDGRETSVTDDYSPGDFLNKLNYGKKLIEQNESVEGLGIFSKADYFLLDNFSASVGLRYDRYLFSVTDYLTENIHFDYSERVMANVNYMFGLLYKTNGKTGIYANYSTAFQTPTTNELSNTPQHSGGFNDRLNPENIFSFEAGIRGILFDDSYYNLTIFIMNINDMLIPYQISDPASEEIFYKNAGKAANTGIELFYHWTPANKLKMKLSFSFNNFRFTDYVVEDNLNGQTKSFQLKNNKVPGVPDFTVGYETGYKFPYGFYTGLSANYNGSYYVNDFNGPPPGSNDDGNNYINDSYIIIKITAGYSFETKSAGFEFNLGINNLFDKRYNGSIVPNAFGKRYFEPAAGRNYYINISLKI